MLQVTILDFVVVYVILLYGLVVSPLTGRWRQWIALRFKTLAPYCPTCVGTYLALALAVVQWYLSHEFTIGLYLVAGTIMFQYRDGFSVSNEELESVMAEIMSRNDLDEQ